MKNEYEMTVNDEILLDLLKLQEEFDREVKELEDLDQMDAGYIDE